MCKGRCGPFITSTERFYLDKIAQTYKSIYFYFVDVNFPNELYLTMA